MNIPAPKTEVLQMGSETQNSYFLEVGLNNVDEISVIYRDHLPA
jgi:hypothetical protein